MWLYINVTRILKRIKFFLLKTFIVLTLNLVMPNHCPQLPFFPLSQSSSKGDNVRSEHLFLQLIISDFEQISMSSSTINYVPNLPMISWFPTQPETISGLINIYKLNDHNYLQWSQSVMMFINERGKDDYLLGVPKPEINNPKYWVWRTKNNLVMSWLISSMNTEIGESFLLLTTSQNIWETAQDTFSSQDNIAELFHIENTLQDFKQGNHPVTTYFTTLTYYWQQMDLFEIHNWKCSEDQIYFKKYKETKRVFKFLMGLDQSLDEVRGRILGKKSLPSLREAFSEVRIEESHMWVMLEHPNPEIQLLKSTEASALTIWNPTYNTKKGCL